MSFQSAAVLDRLLSPGRFDQNSPHGLGRRGEKMFAAVPLFVGVRPNKPQIGFMHQSRRFQRLPRPLLREPMRRQPTQFIVNERQQPLRRVRFAGFDGFQDV